MGGMFKKLWAERECPWKDLSLQMLKKVKIDGWSHSTNINFLSVMMMSLWHWPRIPKTSLSEHTDWDSVGWQIQGFPQGIFIGEPRRQRDHLSVINRPSQSKRSHQDSHSLWRMDLIVPGVSETRSLGCQHFPVFQDPEGTENIEIRGLQRPG